ncbi:MAG TPA: HAD-IC family P-type ATPase, partial [Candidatus Saccharimonas sp.]|nr:HAD-IC family P-type ATPase [Candidatus Saccharimonas sp.]
MTLHGLTSHEAAARLQQYGPNQIVAEHQLPLIVSFLARFNNPLIIILLLAAIVSAFLGDILTFSIITAIVTLSALIDFFTSYRSQQAAEDLKNRVLIVATVIRDGHETQVPLKNLVPGDIVLLKPGNIVPADGRTISSKDLYVNEGALTGESFPQEKPDDSALYMGSSVTSGTGYIEATQTGTYTKFSHIAAQLAGRQPITEFEREIRQFSRLIIIVTGFLVLAIFAFNSLFRHDLFASLLFSLALAVGLTPSLLPLIITLNLTKGSLKMAHNGVIVKKLAAIQNFGSMDVLCTDKTGTLTEDKIALVKYVDSYGNTSDEVLQFAYLASVYSSSYENPLDRAVKDFKHLSTAGWRKQDVVPFTFERKRESVAVSHKGATTLISKGAPETIFEICDKAADGTPMDAKLRDQIHKEYDQLSSDGFRVLAIATKPLSKSKGIEAVDETGMDFHGFIAFLDPAKKSVTATLQKIEDYGVEIKIISGDNALVNQRIAEEIKLPNKGMLTGDQIDKLTATELAQQVEQTTIFARVTPEQKLRIIQTLQANGHVVGYMGDGINDAPSLKAADTGISVNNAVDVAKDTADMILLHKSLGELIEGVVEGRRTFANTLKYLMM